MADMSEGASAAQPPQPPPAPQAPPQAGYAPQAIGVVGRTTAPGMQILLTIVTLGIWAAVWTYRQFEDIKNYTGDGMGGGLAVVLYIFVYPVIPFLLSNDVDTKLYQRDGKQSPINAMTGIWALIPIVGGIIWYLKAQEAINDFWVSKGAVAP